jgi:hypothetical protein
MRSIRQRGRVDEKEELAASIGGILDHHRVLTDDAPVLAAPQKELSNLSSPLLLCHHTLKLDRSLASPRQNAKIPRWHTPSQKAGFRECQRDIPEFQTLQKSVGPTFQIDLKPVGTSELSGLIIVHVQDQTTRNGSGGLKAELEIRVELGEQARRAGELKRRIAGAEPTPIAVERPPCPKAESQIPER